MARKKSTSHAPSEPLPAPNNGGAERISSKWVRVWLAVIVALHLVLAGVYSAVTPAATADQHNPDESAHMLYVASMASGHLPVFRAGQDAYEAHQPPLYYAICAPIYLAARPQGPAVATKAVRDVSTVLGALLVVVTFLTVITFLPGEPLLALGAAAFVALLPMNVALSASVTNDALTNLLIAVGLWLLAKLVLTPPEGSAWLRRSAWLGVVLGVGVWTKTSTLLMFPTVALTFYLLARQKIVGGRPAGQGAGVALGLGLLLGLPWLIRNQMLYGDPVAQHIFVNAFQNTAQASDIARYVFGGSLGAYLLGVARWTFASFWGVFDSMRLFWGQDPHRRTPSPASGLPPLYNLLALLCAVALAGLVRLIRSSALRLTPGQGVVLTTLATLAALTALAHFRFILVFFQAQGRYWYPALVPLALFFVLGWRGWLPRPAAFRGAVAVMALGLLALNAYTLFGLLLPRFSAP